MIVLLSYLCLYVVLIIVCIVEAPMKTPLTIYRVHGISKKLGLNFDQGGINNVMTHVLVLSAKVRRNERLK